MEIPLIYILLGAEALLILLGLCITFAILLLRKPALPEAEAVVEAEAPADEATVNIGSSYIEYLQQAIDRNNVKVKQQQSIEADEQDAQAAADESGSTTEETAEQSPPPDETQSALLQARERFLKIEQTAADKSEHEIHFWESIYNDMLQLVEDLKQVEVITKEDTEVIEAVHKQVESKEKVFYIETQGKKIDGEVNKLKDIIYEQENALNSMKKALHDSEGEFDEDSEIITFMKQQLETIERQLSDSKMCMEVLEMENDRLQEEIDQLEAQNGIGDADSAPKADTNVDVEQMKEAMQQQEERIQALMDTIESLELDASQAEKLKQTLNDFTRSSQEMMSCITILEEENERLLETSATPEAAPPGASNEELDALKGKVSSLEEELIKKDVAFAQLQDEFSSMETEYLAMYEAMHGDNS